MSGGTLSAEVFKLLNGQRIEDKQHEAFMLLSVSEDGWPHSAMVSVGEVVALNREQLRIGLWPETRTTANIIRTGKATLVFCYRGKAYYIRLAMERLEDLADVKHPRIRFAAQIVSVREDVAKYADITSGIQVQLKDPKETLQRWSETVEDLRR